MGWWSITAKRSGLPLTDLLEGRESEKSGMVSGDGPADIMGPAVDKLIALYEKEWGRKPYKQELLSVLNFVSGPYKLKDQP